MCESHINLRELWVAKEWLLRHPHIRDTAIRFDMDKTAAMQCIARQGTARLSALLKLTEEIFALASKRNIHLSVRHESGVDNTWADALSRFKGTSVEWRLRPQVFKSLTERYGTPEVDLFTSRDTALLPLFLSFSQRAQVGGLDAFTEDWNRWNYIYLFPPPATKILLRVVQTLQDYLGQVLLVAPLWEAQPWCSQLKAWCHNRYSVGINLPSGQAHLPSPIVTEVTRLEWVKGG
ncbi:uncharacterized protein LOC123515634 isoform X7 [Portunus trituberculatus]|uniref:Uncharacterized protein n=1 Tax=Portunus trituberculatus TaxID=210409 RepID=A0A5B7DB61_PORTR|nr:uncharacterized protein LOC123515634 isoform X7 [Portunus trituberculatus]MPC18598.1 hypothetical protein [Portunus trituberculatus]